MGKNPKTWTQTSVFRVPVGMHSDQGPERVRGLYLRVSEQGSRYFILRMAANGKRRDMGLGSLSDLTLDEARTRAREARRINRDGDDPIALRAAEKAARRQQAESAGWLFKTAAETVFEEQRPSWRNAKHAAQWINTLKTYAYPTIGTKPLREITVDDITAVLLPIWQTKAQTAQRVQQRLDLILRWAEARGHLDRNPMPAAKEFLPKQLAQKEHHPAMPYADVPAFMATLNTLKVRAGVLALKFVILTAGRTSEILDARWDEIDGDTWIIPGERMKSGRLHRVPLSTAALEVLNQAKEVSDGQGLIFPSPKDPREPLSDMTMMAVLRRLDLPFTVHGFRSSFKDWCTEHGFGGEISERALAHSVRNSTEAAYNRTDMLEQRRPMTQQWADFLSC